MILENLKFLSPYFVLTSGIIGLFNIKKLPDVKAKLILFTIWFTFIFDVVGTHYYKFFEGENFIIYNIYFLLLFIIYFYYYSLAVKDKRLKITIYLLCILFIVFFAVDGSFIANINVVQLFNSYAFGVLLVAISAFLYLFELFNSKNIISYSRSLTFWFTVGILSFHIPFVPFMYSIKFFLIDYNLKVFSLVVFFLNLVMNFCFSFGFIWSKKIYNY